MPASGSRRENLSQSEPFADEQTYQLRVSVLRNLGSREQTERPERVMPQNDGGRQCRDGVVVLALWVRVAGCTGAPELPDRRTS